MKNTLLLTLAIFFFQACIVRRPVPTGNNKNYEVDSVSFSTESFPSRMDLFKDSTPKKTDNTVPFGRNTSTSDSQTKMSTGKLESPAAVVMVPKTLTWLDFESGYAKAVKENKILMVDAYTDWCYWCKVMDRETFTDSAVIKTLNSNFVTVKLNPEKDKTFRFADTTMNQVELYRWLGYGNTFGYPTTYFWISPGKSQERYSLAGYNEPKAFLEILAQISAKKK